MTGRERAALRGLCRYVIVNYLYRVEDRLRTAISTLPKDHPARLHRKGLFDGVRQFALGTATYLCTSDEYRHNKGANIHGGGQAHSSGSLDYFTAEQDGALATDQSGRQLRGVSSLRSSLGRRGFDAEERTTRMVMLPGTMDECIGDWCSSDEEDDDEFVTPLKTPVAVVGMGVPGFNMGALTIASLDLG